jgi:hypothetical protein
MRDDARLPSARQPCGKACLARVRTRSAPEVPRRRRGRRRRRSCAPACRSAWRRGGSPSGGRTWPRCASAREAPPVIPDGSLAGAGAADDRRRPRRLQVGAETVGVVAPGPRGGGAGAPVPRRGSRARSHIAGVARCEVDDRRSPEDVGEDVDPRRRARRRWAAPSPPFAARRRAVGTDVGCCRTTRQRPPSPPRRASRAWRARSRAMGPSRARAFRERRQETCAPMAA